MIHLHQAHGDQEDHFYRELPERRKQQDCKVKQEVKS